MPKLLATCGLDCATCPAYIAHNTHDRALQEKTAKEWAVQFTFDFTPEMIDCVGCTVAGGPHIGHCAECEMRKCGLSKKVDNCALCAEYPCAIISKFTANVPPAKANLEEVRASLKK